MSELQPQQSKWREPLYVGHELYLAILYDCTPPNFCSLFSFLSSRSVFGRSILSSKERVSFCGRDYLSWQVQGHDGSFLKDGAQAAQERTMQMVYDRCSALRSFRTVSSWRRSVLWCWPRWRSNVGTFLFFIAWFLAVYFIIGAAHQLFVKCWQPCSADSDCCASAQRCYETESSCGSSDLSGTDHYFCGAT